MARRFLLNVVSLSGARIFTVLSQIVVLPIVARYLEVSDFGDVALAMTVVIFAQTLSDAGLGRSLIRKRHFDDREWSSVFWLLTLVGFLLTAATAAIAPVWAWLFDRPILGALVTGLSVVPLLSSISAVPNAKIERANRFPAIAGIRAAAAAAGFVVAIFLAISGLGAWALIGQQIAIAAVRCGGAFAASNFRPMSPLVRTPLGDHLTFAFNTIGTSFVFTAQQQVPLMMIGHAFSPVHLGLYSMSQRIWNLPQIGLVGPVAQVAFVHMSRSQANPNRIGAIYTASIQLMSLAILPPLAMLASVGETAFVLLLSEPWLKAAAIFALAAPGIAIDASTSAAGVLFQAVNRTELRLRMVLERTMVRLVIVALALPYGIEAVAGAITVSSVVYLPRIWVHVGRAVPFDSRAAYAALCGPVAFAVLLWGIGRWLQAETTGWTTLGCAAGVLAVTWGGAALGMRPSLRRSLSLFAH